MAYQISIQSGTDSTNNLGSSAKKWLSVYSDTIKAGILLLVSSH